MRVVLKFFGGLVGVEEMKENEWESNGLILSWNAGKGGICLDMGVINI